MKTITLNQFGKDHWSTFAFIETLCVDNRGELRERAKMKCNPKYHVPARLNAPWSGNYSTMLKDGKQVRGHDDWHCVSDLEAAFLIFDRGSGINPKFELTGDGWIMIGRLRRWRAEGGTFENFTP